MAIQKKSHFKLNEKNIFPPFPLFQSQILKVSVMQDTTIQDKLKGDLDSQKYLQQNLLCNLTVGSKTIVNIEDRGELCKRN